MKILRFFQLLATATLLAGTPALAQGPLNPPGAPAPTMKTLVEIEPRTHIVSLPYTITAPGSYYLTTNLNGGGSAAGIVIQASGVTIDLRGFAVENCVSGISASAASATASVREVAIHNGGVRGCSGSGINLGSVCKVRLENVMVSDNGGDGASVGEASLVTQCTAKGNAAHGIALGSGGKVFQCVSQANGGSGIAVTSSCQVADNNCNSNGSGAGLLTSGDGNRVEGNSSNQNQFGFLINGTANLVVRNNACSNTAADYSVSAGNNYGQVLVSPGTAFASSNAWANFGCGTPPSEGCATSADCDDRDACTTDVCTATVCSHTPIPDCGAVICASNVDCNDANPCTTDTCQGGSCVYSPASGAACSDGNACTNGDTCVAGICSGGSATICNDGNACTSDSCNAGTGCTYTAIPGCGAEGCLTAAECPGFDSDCQTRTCQAGVCGVVFAANGTPTASQVAGNCQQTVCDGTGNVVNATSNGDVPADDGNQCTTEYCVAGVPASSYQPYGTACNQSGGTVCDGNGACISNSVCGDGIVQASESCDDGNLINGDGCSASCSIQSGFICTGSPSVCTSVCGDGLVAAGESCDDGNASNGDGCSAICSVESGFNCAGSPSVCSAINYSLTTSRAGSGTGTLSSTPAGISCGADCTESYSSGTVVTLTAASGSGSSFAGWSGGGCSGTGTCVVTMNSAKSVTGTFTLNTYALTVSKSGAGNGIVTSSPAGINCGATCSSSYSNGTSVTLTAAPVAGSSFAGWSGACTGTGTCVVSMTSAKSVTATFN